MKKYTVIIHYQGSVEYNIEADNEESAKSIAEDKFAIDDITKITEDMIYKVCDCWED